MSFRIEQKIPITPSQENIFIDHIMKRGAKRLYPNRSVKSVYFDNSKLKLYHDSEEGLLPRKKFRIRTYPNDKILRYSLEKKISSCEGRFKTISSIGESQAMQLKTQGIFDPELGSVSPVLTVQYDRQYFTLNGIRITIDTNIEYNHPAFENSAKDSMNVIELKSPIGTSQERLDNVFSSQRARFSKYCRGIKLLNL